MRRVPAALLVVLAACSGDDPPPLAGGGGGGTGGSGGGGSADAGAGGSDGALTGTLCAALDVRDPLECPQATLGGIEVLSLGPDVVDTTAAGGGFELDVSANADILLAIGRTSEEVRDTLAATGSWRVDDDLRIPTVAQDDWDQLTGELGVIEPDATASIAIYIEDRNGPVPGAEVIPPEGTAEEPFYDSDVATGWQPGALTGEFGAVLLFGAPAVDNAVLVGIAIDADVFYVSVPVREDHLTTERIVLDTTGG